MKKMIYTFLVCLLMFSSSIFAAEEKKIVITVYEEWSSKLGIIKELLSESYNEIGYKVIFKDLPPARSLNELSHGTVDGDIARTEIVARNYNAILVRPPYFTLRSYAYYPKNQFKTPPSLHDIRTGKVGYMHGAFAVEKFLINTKSRITANDQTQLLNLLKRHRVDYIVPNASMEMKHDNLGKVLLFEMSVYHILLNKHKNLAKKLESVLRKNMAKKKFAHLDNQVKKLILGDSE